MTGSAGEAVYECECEERSRDSSVQLRAPLFLTNANNSTSHARNRARYEAELEEHSAVLEMQATVRRVFASMRVQLLREHRAATNIQRVHRGNGGRQMAEARREYLRMKYAASVIENAWINLQVIRSAKRLVRNKKLAKAARTIQGMWRARVARRRVQMMKEHRNRERKVRTCEERQARTYLV